MVVKSALLPAENEPACTQILPASIDALLPAEKLPPVMLSVRSPGSSGSAGAMVRLFPADQPPVETMT